MRRHALLLALLPVLVFAACSKNVNRQIKEAVANFDNLDLSENEIEILSTQEMGGSAVAQVQIKTAVKLVKKNNQWIVDEVRIGDRRWEKADHIRAVLRTERTETTQQQLRSITEGLRRYLDLKGTVPQVSDFRDLAAVLIPEYMPEVLMLDAWSNSFTYRPLSPEAAEVRSNGPDGLHGTQDDLTQRINK